MPESISDVRLDNEGVWEAVSPRLREMVIAGRFTLSEEVAEFEEAAAQFFACEWAVGTSSGTSALTLALRGARLAPKSRVGLPANTFFATLEAVVGAGHTPVVVDVGDDFVLRPQELDGLALDAIIPVHLFGLPVDMPAIMDLARASGWWVLEDCSQAHGASVGGQPVGSFGDAGAFSAYPTKNLGAWGDAGFVTGTDRGLRDAIQALRSHGQREPNVHEEIAGTDRLDSIQAVILAEKLKRLPEEVAARRLIAGWYREALGDLGLCLPEDIGSRCHAYHQFVVRVPRRDEVRRQLQDLGVATAVHYPTPVHLQPAALSICEVPRRPRNAEEFSREILSLPMHPALTPGQVDRVAGTLAQVMRYGRPGRASS